MSPHELTTNERRILTLLYKQGPLSKRQLAERGGMGWATVVKMIDRLAASGLVTSSGEEPAVRKRGKNPQVYGVSHTRPLAIGVDVEYRTTTIVLTNLRAGILAKETTASPSDPDTSELQDFLGSLISLFLVRNNINRRDLAGAGIGVPGIGLPTWLNPRKDRRDLAGHLEDRLGFPVRTEINVRAYTVFERWNKQSFPMNDFMLLSIRTGVGSGIIQNGHLFTGYQGFAGEIGHMKVAQEHGRCRCGSVGCLETVANQNFLYDRYQSEVLGKTPARPATSQELHDGLARLFSDAAAGSSAALRIVQETGSAIGRALSSAVLILNLPTVIVSGHFGPDGDVLLRSIEQEIHRGILPKISFRLRYYPFDPEGFTRGAALLVLNDYFTDVPETETGRLMASAFHPV